MLRLTLSSTTAAAPPRTSAVAPPGVSAVGVLLLLVLVLVLAFSGVAQAAGCEVLRAPRDRAECETRAAAREAARREVERRVGASGANADVAADVAKAFDAGSLVEPRPLAAVGGIAWFLLAMRARRRAARRTRVGRAF